MPVAPQLPNFDYSSEMQFGFRARLHLDQIRSSVGIDDQSTLAFFLLVDCERSNVRFKEVVTVSEGEEFECWLTVPPGQLATKVRLERGLVLDELGSSDVWDSPKRRGALLFSDDPCSVQLEGGRPAFRLKQSTSLPKDCLRKLRGNCRSIATTRTSPSTAQFVFSSTRDTQPTTLCSQRSATTSLTRHCDQTSHVSSSPPCPETNSFLLNKNGETKALAQSSTGCVAPPFPTPAQPSHPKLPPRSNAFDAHIQNAFGYMESNK